MLRDSRSASSKIDQLEASREILAVIPTLADIAEDVENEQQKQALATAMQKLLDSVGRHQLAHLDSDDAGAQIRSDCH